MVHSRCPRTVTVWLMALAAAIGLSPSFAQERMSDKDIEKTMNNLKEDAKRFRSSFNSEIGKSTIRKTSQEKDAKNLVQRFQKDTEGMLNHFKSSKKADPDLRTVLSAADQIEKIMVSTLPGGRAASDWSKVKSELSILSKEFNVASSVTGGGS
jgi:hypothetical protein